MSDITIILNQVEQGDPQAAAQLLTLVYGELHRLAEQRMSHERAGHTLQPTALVHEAYIRLVDAHQDQKWNNRGHFFAAAAEAMRRILVENARRKRAIIRGGDRDRVDLDLVEPCLPRISEDILMLNDALEKFEKLHKAKAELVKLRYFAGLTMDQAAAAIGVSVATAHRYWNYSRAWLHQEIVGDDGDSAKVFKKE